MLNAETFGITAYYLTLKSHKKTSNVLEFTSMTNTKKLVKDYPMTAIGTNEACKILNNISRLTLARWVNEKRVRGYRLGYRWFYFPDELLEDIKASTTQATNKEAKS